MNRQSHWGTSIVMSLSTHHMITVPSSDHCCDICFLWFGTGAKLSRWWRKVLLKIEGVWISPRPCTGPTLTAVFAPVSADSICTTIRLLSMIWLKEWESIKPCCPLYSDPTNACSTELQLRPWQTSQLCQKLKNSTAQPMIAEVPGQISLILINKEILMKPILLTHDRTTAATNLISDQFLQGSWLACITSSYLNYNLFVEYPNKFTRNMKSGEQGEWLSHKEQGVTWFQALNHCPI